MDVRSETGELERVRPQDIKTTALFSIEGELDDISGSGQTEAVHGICSGVPRPLQKHLEIKGAGHYGIFSGRRWRDMVYPQVKAFILSHQPSAQPAPTAAKPAHQLELQVQPQRRAASATKSPVRTAKLALPVPVRSAAAPKRTGRNK